MESGEGIDGSRVERIAFSEMEDSEGGKRVMTLMSDTDRPSEVGEKDETACHGFGSERAVLLVFCHPVLDDLRRPVADGALETERETRHESRLPERVWCKTMKKHVPVARSPISKIY